MNEADIQPYRQRLLTLAARLRGDVSRLQGEALGASGRRAAGEGPSGTPVDQEDLSSREADEELSLTLLGTEEQTLEEIAAALERIKQGSFGYCLECGKVLPRERLRAVPYTRYCVACANRHEAETLP
jgi:RNA polymerase-binding transcription factor DksA